MLGHGAVSKGHRIHTVDVFAEQALAGNQLAVVLDASDIPGETMQRIAKEMNIAETTFVLPPHDPANAASRSGMWATLTRLLDFQVARAFKHAAKYHGQKQTETRICTGCRGAMSGTARPAL